MMKKLTENQAIETLKALANRWPDTLWIFSANGTMCIMHYDANGNHGVDAYGCMDQRYLVDTIQGIDNDGGDF
jgi:hypothetical protein